MAVTHCGQCNWTIMNLTDAQKQEVARWLGEGLKLAEIQKRIETQFSLRPTYMEVKMLVSELNILPKDPDPPKAPVVAPGVGGQATPAPLPAEAALLPEPEALPGTPARVKLSVDRIARAGAIVSGEVVFSDGNKALWYLDQMGRLGLAPEQKGYRPPAEDVQEFQATLEKELSKLGY